MGEKQTVPKIFERHIEAQLRRVYYTDLKGGSFFPTYCKLKC